MERNFVVINNPQELSQKALEFLATCDTVLEILRKDIHEQVVRQERILPMPSAFFYQGRPSASQHVWELYPEVSRMLKDQEENGYNDAMEEVALYYRTKEAVRYSIYRLAYTPISEIHGKKRDETAQIDTFTSIPVISEYATAQFPPTHPTVPLSPEQVEETLSGGTDTLMKIAAGETTDEKLEEKPTRSKKEASA